MTSGLVFDTKRYAINDGPGIRITIFLKGCPLACKWCHNPESISSKMEKLYTADKCIGAQSCIEICPENALKLTEKGIITDYNLCTMCGKCEAACPTNAIEMAANPMDVEEIMAVILEERILFDQSGGGVTFSGGEPLMHYVLLKQLLDECSKEGIHRTIDTTGFTKTDILLDVATRTDHWLYDLKQMDNTLHKQWTGVGNELILKNLKALSETGASINIRIPLIEGVNADDKNMHQTAEFVAGLAGDKKMVNILAYHNIMQKKYEKLGQPMCLDGISEPSAERQQEVIEIFNSYGLEAMTGG